MKTFVLSADGIQQFTKLIYDQQKTAAAIAAVTQMEQNHLVNNNASNSILSNTYHNVQPQQYQQPQPQQQPQQQQPQQPHVMSLQYYLKHPMAVSAGAAAANISNSSVVLNGNGVNYPTTVIQSHHLHQHHNQQLQQQNHQHTQQIQQIQAQQQPQQIQQHRHTALSTNLRLKQPNGSTINSNVHHAQLSNSYHNHQHHPYYISGGGGGGGGGVAPSAINTTLHALPSMPTVTISSTTTATSNRQQQQHHQQHQQQQHTNVPVHALNQNSNFSAASSSTGGGTISSHAPTQQSNTTGPSLSPPAAVSANPRTQQANNNNNNNNNKNALITPPPRNTSVNSVANNGTTNSSSGSSSNTGNSKKARTEPVLSQFHQNERLTFANAHLTWSQEHWRRLLLQDERKFNLDGPDGYSNYYHDLRNYERTLSQRPRGISVYVYLLVTAAGPIHLEVSTSKVGAEAVIDTILRQRANIIAKLGGNTDFLLQDHNWTTNALPAAQELLNAEGIKTQKWPTIAHDMNIMENVWGWIIREVYDGGRKFSRKDDLIFRIREAWARLPMDLIRNLYSTLPERVSELYLTRGAYTNC